MSAEVETMAYAGQIPWHGLGTKVDPTLTPEQMAKAAGIDWTVSKQKLYLASKKLVPGRWALMRDSDEKVFSVVGDAYNPVQNLDAMTFFKKFVDAGHMQMETCGALYGGRYIWGLASINASFNLGRKDKVKGYLLLSQPHIVNKAMDIRVTTIRVVCVNTFQMAMAGATNGKTFRMPHQVKFDDNAKAQAEIALGIATDQFTSFKDGAEALAGKKASEDEAVEYFFEVLRCDEPEKLEALKTGQFPKQFREFQKALQYAPGQELSTAKGTWWGAFNAVTFTVDHTMGRNRDNGLKDAWFGNSGHMKRRAWQLALQKVV